MSIPHLVIGLSDDGHRDLFFLIGGNYEQSCLKYSIICVYTSFHFLQQVPTSVFGHRVNICTRCRVISFYFSIPMGT